MSGYKRVNFYDLCRLCATHQQREKTHIFEEKGRKIQLQDKIQNFLSLQVCENDFLPKVVCAKCLESLEKSCIFRQECYNSETMLVSYFSNFRHTEEFKKSGKVYIKDVSQKSVGTEVELDSTSSTATGVTMATASTNTDCAVHLIPNVLPQEMLSSFYTLQIPQVTNTTQSILQQATPVVAANQLVQQMQDNHKLISQAPILYNNKVVPSIIKNNNTAGAISLRVNSNGEIISTTPVIDINTYINPQKLIPHRKIPDNPSIVKIDLTAEPDKQQPPTVLTSNQPIVYNHIQHNNFNRATNVTNMNVISVPYDSVVVNPQQPSQGESPVSTPSPPPTVPTYNQHQLSDTTFTPPTTSTTSLDIFTTTQTKANYNTLPQDQNTISTDKPKSFSCSICLKNFKKREHLYQHVKLHSGFRPYKCENCNKSYIRKEHLMRHLTAHNGEKKFMCEICERSFSRHDNLLKHKKTHDKLNYTCNVCNRKFVFEHFFLAHKMTHEVKCSIVGIS